MIAEQFLDLLRCPLDPDREAKIIVEDETKLLCSRCRLQFRKRDGFPSFVVEEATLPEECAHIDQMPCRVAGRMCPH